MKLRCNKRNEEASIMIQEQKRLVEKSVEAFILGLEIYNKPSKKQEITPGT